MSAKGRGAIIPLHEVYNTPATAINSLLDELWPLALANYRWGEPGAGIGSIISEMHKRGVEPRKWEWAEIREGKDYLKQGLTGPVDCIIDNPPFSLAQQFIDRGLSDARFNAHLLRLNFFGSQKRMPWWQDKMPTHLFVLSQRPSFTGKGTDSIEYAWFVWDYLGLCKREPGMYVI